MKCTNYGMTSINVGTLLVCILSLNQPSSVGISIISAQEAAQLKIPTLPIPGTDQYLIELDVFHQIHCLNMIRKVFHPERYGNKFHALMDEEGNVNRTHNQYLHWGGRSLPPLDSLCTKHVRPLSRQYPPIPNVQR
jgi:hypothetical protein